MQKFFSLQDIDRVTAAIGRKINIHPRVGIILGSGLNDMAASVSEATTLPYGDIPEWPVSTVVGHAGQLVVGHLEDQPVLVMQGRIHYYEGYSMAQVTLPVRVMQRLGIEIMIVTNAAGGVNPAFSPGDVMLITDNLNFVGMAGANPLMGPNIDELGPRFPDMSQSYDRELMAGARKVATEEQISLREGVYCALSGPSFESPADLRFLHAVGADAVGMSTVPEVIVAVHMGIRVAGISCITNMAAGMGPQKITHDEVLETTDRAKEKFRRLLNGIIKAVGSPQSAVGSTLL